MTGVKRHLALSTPRQQKYRRKEKPLKKSPYTAAVQRPNYQALESLF